ncbi:hypothetical protein E2C01_061428 [Portunus trituberculatus]|uniref:Uncharacterized protein n=1 Tax=Portunus trituberculatus TaxID=210409 RepID=A0A5B7HCD9_PORTR|nr:hypothetical protein [Portunus trituberculatus]
MKIKLVTREAELRNRLTTKEMEVYWRCLAVDKFFLSKPEQYNVCGYEAAVPLARSQQLRAS